MITIKEFDYQTGDHENEKASNSYLMSLIAMIAGVPLPILNLLATLVFFLGNRKGTYFVRWHCTQALLGQFSLLFVNSAGFWWTLWVILDIDPVTNSYIGYMFTLLIFNGIELVSTIYTAINVRKGIHVEWWLYGSLTNLICKPKL